MQKNEYDNEAHRMNIGNHSQHNSNPDYWNILVNDTLDQSYKDKIGLDFGCGCGRNVMNLVDRFKRMDGVDISSGNINNCIKNIEALGYGQDRATFHVCDGVSLNIFESNTYDFIMSTIVLQHICVYDIRYNYLKEFFRVLKPGGMISIQMGCGTLFNQHLKEYHENFYDAPATNSYCDVQIDDPNKLVKDLENIGFTNIQYVLRPPFDDGAHSAWIYIKAVK